MDGSGRLREGYGAIRGEQPESGVMNERGSQQSGSDVEPYSRISIIHLQNGAIGDGIFIFEVAKTLREYADMLENGQAGREHVEIYDGPRGTKLTAIGVTWYGERIPRRSQIEDLHPFAQKTK